VSVLAGWALALLAVVAGWRGWGLPGLALAFTVIVFWLLLQWSRTLRVLRRAGAAPMGRVPSAVMFHARLHAGMPMSQVVALAGSLGAPVDGQADTWRWADASGASVRLVFSKGRCRHWTLQRDTPAATESVS
jgi:hypothetical protein